MIGTASLLAFINNPEIQETIRIVLFYVILLGFPVGNLLLEAHYYEDRKTYCTQVNIPILLRTVTITYAIFIVITTVIIFIGYDKIFVFGVLYEIAEAIYYLYGRWAMKEFYKSNMSYSNAKTFISRLENALLSKTLYTLSYVLSACSVFGVIK